MKYFIPYLLSASLLLSNALILSEKQTYGDKKFTDVQINAFRKVDKIITTLLAGLLGHKLIVKTIKESSDPDKAIRLENVGGDFASKNNPLVAGVACAKIITTLIRLKLYDKLTLNPFKLAYALSVMSYDDWIPFL